ncbi:MAG TPA: Rrf2 family transcriptional regulator [Thermodesulfovibrio thiophilus]|nr:Rrf2 family transcriptional regulator [Thermodesulfovibrio thiophilus]HQD36853.1 Rrf2 family transcriptional regulator [Thermodesulfovibrio thiophilus]
MTRETDYAIRTVLYLSGRENYFAKAEDISKTMDIPKSFLRKILKQLEKQGLLRIKRGVSGGITLIKKPEEITLYDTIIAVEKNVALNRCVVNKTVCGFSSQCPVHPVWFKLRDGLIKALKEINFSGLISQGTVL